MSTDPARFAGRRALVTGASRGIGAAVAERLAAEGAAVAIVARTLERHPTLPGSLRETAARLRRYGPSVVAIRADLADETERRRMVEDVTDRLGAPVDILVNNAAAAVYQPVVDYPLRRRRLVFEVNVHAPLDLAQLVLPAMRQRGEGWIVNLSSATACLVHGAPPLAGPPSTMAVYGASKAALNRLSQGLAQELVASGVRVNTIEPRAAVLTEGAAALMGESLRPEQIESMEEMVEAAVALCCCPPERTGRVHVSLDLLAELGIPPSSVGGVGSSPRA